MLHSPYGLSVLSFWRPPGTPPYAVPDALLPELLRHVLRADPSQRLAIVMKTPATQQGSSFVLV